MRERTRTTSIEKIEREGATKQRHFVTFTIPQPVGLACECVRARETVSLLLVTAAAAAVAAAI